MTQVRFMSRWDFINIIRAADNHNNQLDNRFAIISLNDTETEQKEMEQHVYLHTQCDNKIFMTFQDVDHPDNGGISNRQAKKLFQFIKENEGKSFVVHCFAGVSRSAAVAKFIQEYYDIDDPILESYKIYNRMVFSKLNAQIGSMSMEDYYREIELQDEKRNG